MLQQRHTENEKAQQRPAVAFGNDGLNMDETERHKDKSTAELEKSLRHLRIRLTRSIRAS
jgi:hypothetical protein